MNDEDRPAKTVPEDYEAIDTANIIPRSKRRAALASGLARVESRPSSSSSSKPSVAAAKPKSRKVESDDEEAEL